MYYEEIVFDGVLHYRRTPAEAFNPFTKEQLTARLLCAEKTEPVRGVEEFKSADSDEVHWVFQGGLDRMDRRGRVCIDLPDENAPGRKNVVVIPVQDVTCAQAIVHAIISHREAVARAVRKDTLQDFGLILINESKNV